LEIFQKNNTRHVIKSHIIGRELRKGFRLTHFKEPTVVRAETGQCRNRNASQMKADLKTGPEKEQERHQKLEIHWAQVDTGMLHK
jgi:hypothetical protein